MAHISGFPLQFLTPLLSLRLFRGFRCNPGRNFGYKQNQFSFKARQSVVDRSNSNKSIETQCPVLLEVNEISSAIFLLP